MAGRPLARILVMAALLAGGLAAVRWSRTTAAPAAGRADDLIAAVNELRAGYGMAPLKVDPILMAVAQAQNKYNMSIGSVTHIGPTGLRPKQRAIAAGYGGGRTIFASENILYGSGLTPADAVQIWTGSDPHLNTMIGQYYRDIGAGAGESGGFVYYTLITGYVAGGLSANSTVPAGGVTLPQVNPVRPVVKATAGEDGSVVHVVEAGQTLWTIAAVYDVEMDVLLGLNALTERSLLHPGDRITVRGATTATPTPPPSETPGPTATATPRPTRRPTAVPTPTPVASAAGFELNPTTLFAAWAVVVLLVGAIFAARRM